MGMVFCRGCGKQIHESAQNCPHCGAPHSLLAVTTGSANNSLWMPIASVVLGIFTMLTFFDDSPWDWETLLGCGIFAGTGLAFGAINVSNNVERNHLGIAGVIISSLALLILLGIAIS